MIIPALYDRQKQRGGYLTHADMADVAEELGVPKYRVNALVTFFPHFRLEPPPKIDVHVCRDMSCHLNGGVTCANKVATWAKEQYGDQVQVHGTSCLGRRDRPPLRLRQRRARP